MRGETAPHGEVDVELPLGRTTLSLEAVEIHGGGDAVDGHIDERRDATRGRCRRCAGEALPIRSGVTDVNVTVNQTWKEDRVRADGDVVLRVELGVAREDSGDPALTDRDRARSLAVVRHDPLATKDQVEFVVVGRGRDDGERFYASALGGWGFATLAEGGPAEDDVWLALGPPGHPRYCRIREAAAAARGSNRVGALA